MRGDEFYLSKLLEMDHRSSPTGIGVSILTIEYRMVTGNIIGRGNRAKVFGSERLCWWASDCSFDSALTKNKCSTSSLPIYQTSYLQPHYYLLGIYNSPRNPSSCDIPSFPHHQVAQLPQCLRHHHHQNLLQLI